MEWKVLDAHSKDEHDRIDIKSRKRTLIFLVRRFYKEEFDVMSRSGDLHAVSQDWDIIDPFVD